MLQLSGKDKHATPHRLPRPPPSPPPQCYQAGKSTVLRTVASIALLGNVGLLVPAQHASVPELSAFVLRTFSSDSPAEGKSAFAVEMDEMGWVGGWPGGGMGWWLGQKGRW